MSCVTFSWKSFYNPILVILILVVIWKNPFKNKPILATIDNNNQSLKLLIADSIDNSTYSQNLISKSSINITHNIDFIENRLHEAVIVEPRKNTKLLKVLKNFIEFLPNDTVIRIYHTTLNEFWLRSQLINNKTIESYIASHKIKLTNIASLGYRKIDWRIYTLVLLMDIAFWKSMEGENILIFQTDTALCSRSRHRLEEYIGKYDYIGGPYPRTAHANTTMRHQNGGFSLRKKSKMISALIGGKERWRAMELIGDRLPNEDVFYSVYAADWGLLKPAPYEVAKTFCVDSVYYDSPYAVHKVWARFNSYNAYKKSITRLRTNCPEIRTVLGH